jgi:hypothetical protein
MPLIIRNGRAAACQGVAPRKRSFPALATGFPPAGPTLTKLLRIVYAILTAGGFFLNCIAFRSRPAQKRPALHNGTREQESTPMREIEAGTLLLFPAALAVAFLLWVLWNLLKQDRQIASWLAARRRKSLASSQRTDLRTMPSRPAILHRG